MYSSNCTSGSNLYWTPVAGALVVSLVVHGVTVSHDFGHALFPPQEHTEISSKSTASVGSYAAGFAISSGGSALSSTVVTIRY